MKIGIIIESIRDGRAGKGVADWVAQQAVAADAATFEVIDLKDFDLPLLTAPTVPADFSDQIFSPTDRRHDELAALFTELTTLTLEVAEGR